MFDLRRRGGMAARRTRPAVATKDRLRDNVSEPLNRACAGCVLAKRKVSPHLIIVRRVRRKNLSQVRLAKDHQPVQALATHGANQPLHIRILPWRSRRDRSVADAHRPNPRTEGMSVSTVVVTH